MLIIEVPCEHKKLEYTISSLMEDEEGFREYISKHGHHFSDKLAEEAISKMEYTSGSGSKWNVNDTKKVFSEHGHALPKDCTWGDATYALNMAATDFLNISIKDIETLCKQAYADLSDIDGYSGKIFNRFLSDKIGKSSGKVDIKWKTFI